MQTIFRVSDNSGVKSVRCLKVIGGFKKKVAKIGDKIIVSVRKVKSSTRKYKIVKGDILQAIIVGCKTKIIRFNGVSISYKINSVVLFNQKKLLGTRILIPLIKEFRSTKYMKFISLSTNLL